MSPTRPPKFVATAPERIWLQIDDNVELLDEPFPRSPNDSEVTWCAASVSDVEVEYVRADIALRLADTSSDAALVANLRTLVLRMARALKLAGQSELADRAIDFLTWNGIGPNPLR